MSKPRAEGTKGLDPPSARDFFEIGGSSHAVYRPAIVRSSEQNCTAARHQNIHAADAGLSESAREDPPKLEGHANSISSYARSVVVNHPNWLAEFFRRLAGTARNEEERARYLQMSAEWQEVGDREQSAQSSSGFSEEPESGSSGTA